MVDWEEFLGKANVSSGTTHHSVQIMAQNWLSRRSVQFLSCHRCLPLPLAHPENRIMRPIREGHFFRSGTSKGGELQPHDFKRCDIPPIQLQFVVVYCCLSCLFLFLFVPPQWLVIVLSGIFNYAQLVCLIQFNLGQVNGTKFANINLSKHE